jgi:hypothetical protein
MDERPPKASPALVGVGTASGAMTGSTLSDVFVSGGVVADCKDANLRLKA